MYVVIILYTVYLMIMLYDVFNDHVAYDYDMMINAYANEHRENIPFDLPDLHVASL